MAATPGTSQIGSDDVSVKTGIIGSVLVQIREEKKSKEFTDVKIVSSRIEI
jgi:hypothetical protein